MVEHVTLLVGPFPVRFPVPRPDANPSHAASKQDAALRSATIVSVDTPSGHVRLPRTRVSAGQVAHASLTLVTGALPSRWQADPWLSAFRVAGNHTRMRYQCAGRTRTGNSRFVASAHPIELQRGLHVRIPRTAAPVCIPARGFRVLLACRLLPTPRRRKAESVPLSSPSRSRTGAAHHFRASTTVMRKGILGELDGQNR